VNKPIPRLIKKSIGKIKSVIFDKNGTSLLKEGETGKFLVKKRARRRTDKGA